MTFCAGDGNGTRDSCKGDSGGAFVRHLRRGRVHRQWVAVGLVSWGYGCAQPGQYGYTRVYPFIRWINYCKYIFYGKLESDSLSRSVAPAK